MKKNSLRAHWWNYGNEASYFITICTYKHFPFFGTIQEGEMNLNEIGKIAYENWSKTTYLRKYMNVDLGEFVVMPNHIHGIIHLKASEMTDDESSFEIKPNLWVSPSNNLSSIIRGYKSSVTSEAKKISNFKWQRSYYDHIIRSESSFLRITNYIINNPSNWEEDRFWKKM